MRRRRPSPSARVELSLSPQQSFTYFATRGCTLIAPLWKPPMSCRTELKLYWDQYKGLRELVLHFVPCSSKLKCLSRRRVSQAVTRRRSKLR